MQLINNRYRVIKVLEQTYQITSYLVADILRNHEQLCIHILNNENIAESSLSIFVEDFFTLKNANSSGIINIYQFNLITSVDSRPIKECKYFYSTEYVGEQLDSLSYIRGLTDEDKLDLFVSICRCVNALHLKGIFYGNIRPSNIIFFFRNGRVQVKLRDLVSVRIEGFDMWKSSVREGVYKSVDNTTEQETSRLSDIYSLGMLLMKAFAINISQSEQNSPSKACALKLLKIASRMLSNNPEEQFTTINEVIAAINEDFNRKYSAFDIEEREKLNFNIKLVGREYPKLEVINAYSAMKSKNAQLKIISIHGEGGVGKTRFLMEVRHRFKIYGSRVYHAFSLDETSRRNNKGSISVLKKFISDCSPKILEKYETELVKFIPEIGENRQIIPSVPLLGEKEKFRLLNRLSNFLVDFTKDEPVILIIDNMHFADQFFLELIEYFYSNRDKSYNLMIVFSYEDGQYTNNADFRSFLDKFNGKSEFINIKLSSFNEDETGEFIQNILGMPYKTVRFAKRIYTETFGNPMFIEEVIKNLFTKHELYINPESGNWKTDYEMQEVPVPDSMEQAVFNQIKQINTLGYEVLSTISVFNEPVSIETISRCMCLDIVQVQTIIDDLVWRGIISQNIHDRGFVFDFYNKLLKKLLYSRLSEDEKTHKHEIIVNILEEAYESGDKSAEEELIYHLEMAGEREKLIKYCVENAYNLEKLNIREGAIRNLEKAIGIIETNTGDIRLIVLLIKVGDIYNDIGDVDNSLKYYQRASELSNRLKEVKYEVDCLNKIAEIYQGKSEIEKSYINLSKASDILLENQYIEGILENKVLWAKLYEVKQEYEKALKQCEEGIELCSDDFLLQKGRLLHVLGNLHYYTGKEERAMQIYEQSISCFEGCNFLKGTLSPLNNIGVIYSEYFQNNEKSLEYFYRLKEVSEKNNFVQSETLALVNIADSYFNCLRYEEALTFFEEALKKAERYDIEGYVFYCYLYLTQLYLFISDNSNAIKYFTLTNEELVSHPEQGRHLIDYYRIAAQVLSYVGDLDRAEALVEKALERCANEGSIFKWYSQVAKAGIELKRADSEIEIEKIINDIKFFVKKFVGTDLKLSLIYDICIELYSRDYIRLSRELFNEFDSETKIQRLQMKRLFLQGGLGKDSGRIISLTQALEINKKVKDKQLQWRVCSAIGDYYFSRKSYFYAVNYYFDACEAVKDLVYSLPEKYRAGFVNYNHMSEPLYKLFMVKQHYSNIFDENIERLQNIKTARDIDIIFQYVDLKDIITNKYFIKSAQSIYDSLHGNAAENLRDIVLNLHSDSIEDLDMILKYLSRITLAGTGVIFSEDYNGSYSILSTVNYDINEFDVRFAIEHVRTSRQPLLIAEGFNDSGDNMELDMISAQTKAVICIPVIVKKSNEDVREERRNMLQDKGQILGYVCLHSEKILNNFNSATLNTCIEMIPLIGLIIEKHQLKISSSIDKLTGTLTRKYLEDLMLKQLENAYEGKKTLSILMFDLDNFKGINDSFGHQTGDEVLKNVCETVMNNIRREDSCGRYGGEEFLVILPDTDMQGAQAVAEKLRQRIENKKLLGDKRPVTVSIGVATYPVHGSDGQELIEKADQALYVAKETGRNKSQVWQKEFSGKIKGTYKLTGIVSGNTVQDYRKVSVMIDIIDLVKKDEETSNKIFELLGRIIEITESQQGILFVADGERIEASYCRKIFNNDWIDARNYNKTILKSVISKKQGIYLIDWDEIVEYDPITGMPDWKSVVAVPMINSGEVKGALYLSASAKMKEYKYDDFNFINALGQIAVAIL